MISKRNEEFVQFKQKLIDLYLNLLAWLYSSSLRSTTRPRAYRQTLGREQRLARHSQHERSNSIGDCPTPWLHFGDRGTQVGHANNANNNHHQNHWREIQSKFWAIWCENALKLPKMQFLKVQTPETMQETFMSDSEDELGEWYW